MNSTSIFNESVSYRPFKYPYLMESVVRHNIDMFWDQHQLDFSDDIKQYHSEDGLKTENVSHEVNKNILTKTLNLFTQMDVAAGQLYCELLPHVKNNEVRNWLMAAANREGTHQRCYAAAVEELGFPESTWTEFMDYAEMQDKIDAVLAKDTDPSTKKGWMKTLARLFLSEGIALFGAFASMLNLRRYGLMQGTNKVNEWSLKDEEEHVSNNIKIFLGELRNFSKEDREDILDYVKTTADNLVTAEHKFIDLVYEMGDQEGMTKDDMKNYICYLGDLRLSQLNMESVYGQEENPLGWMEWVLSGKKHTNFFEERVTDYSHEKLGGTISYNDYRKVLSYHPPKSVDTSEVFTVYGTGWCSYCKKVTDFLKENGLEYKYYDLDVDLDAYEYFKLQGHKTIPQVYGEDGTWIGGCDDTLEVLTSSVFRV